MIDVDKLRSLIQLMVDNDLSEVDLRDSDKTVTIKRNTTQVVSHVNPAPAPSAAPAGGGGAAVAGGSGRAPDDPDAGLVAVESPMVGTFYTSPNPDSPPFVSVGKPVGPDTIVCLIEAMKVFNEVRAECSGVIERVLVKSGDPVEFGQKLFLVRPA